MPEEERRFGLRIFVTYSWLLPRQSPAMVCQAGRQLEKLVESLAIASFLDQNVRKSSVGIPGFLVHLLS
jgi:hypothetical protein